MVSDEELGRSAVEAIVRSKKTPVKVKKELLQKEIRAGKQDVFRGLMEWKRAIQTPTKSLGDVGDIAKKTQTANIRINKGRGRILFAKKQMLRVNKKFWK